MLSIAYYLLERMDLYQTLNSLAPNCNFGFGMNDFGSMFYLFLVCFCILVLIVYLGDNNTNNAEDIINDFPPTDEPVYILGRKYSSHYELEDIRSDVNSIVWVTYRRNFTPIGDSGLTSDSGWGCMLRTGQMVLSQALIRMHLGRNWRWKRESLADDPEHEEYLNILKQFSDKKTASYSIHQIALMGACEGKNVGEWFGPNTVAQVLKKLSIYDKFNDIHIHVALDNMVFVDDIKKFCKSKIKLENVRLFSKADEAIDLEEEKSFWRPLILFIPLRLGLSELNPVYFRAIKSTFAFPQTLGILGGRPNHALYFIGCCGDDLIYLDPHTTQSIVELSNTDTEIVHDSDEPLPSIVDDSSYHCERASRMPISHLDPSISLCFLCKTEEEFDQWANLILKKLIQDEEQPLFEIMKERPANWPVFEEEFELHQPMCSNLNIKTSSDIRSGATSDACLLESDEDYEIID